MIATILLVTVTITFSNSEALEPSDTPDADIGKLLKSNLFVDKTDIVKSFVQSKDLLMVMAPRRFGKSTNLDIIKRFFEISVDKSGNPLPRRDTDNYKLFADNNLNIYRDRAFFDKNFGTHPVIQLNLKRINCSDYTTFLASFRHVIAGIYRDHNYLLTSSVLEKYQTEEMRQLQNQTYVNSLSKRYLKQSLNDLASLLFNHFNRSQPILLVDDYDKPLREAVSLAGKDVDKINMFINKCAMEMAKENYYVYKTLVTASTRLDMDVSSYNTQYVRFLADKRFSKLYGFTEEEMRSLLGKHNALDKLPDVKRWYGGYYAKDEYHKPEPFRVGNDADLTIYNPFSVTEYLARKQLKSYWVNSIGVKTLERILSLEVLGRKINRIVEYNSTAISLIKLQAEDVLKMQRILRGKVKAWECSESDAHLFVQYMTDMGYFNVAVRGERSVIVEIPNLEIQTEIKRCLDSVDYLKAEK